MKPSFVIGSCAVAGLIALSTSPVGGAPDSLHVSHAECGASEAEITAEVPALTAFHDVIFELWHGAWPEKNVALIKELLPRVQTDFAAVQKAELPGILRDKQAAWEKGLEAMAASVSAYESAAGKNDTQALLDAVEDLHARFEQQMRIVRPYMRELEDYHVFLYQIYHHWAPGQDLDMLSGAVDSLRVRCAPLQTAKPPRWYQGDPETLKAEIGALCGRTETLDAAAGGADWKQIQKAVESVHDQYVKILSLFEKS